MLFLFCTAYGFPACGKKIVGFPLVSTCEKFLTDSVVACIIRFVAGFDKLGIIWRVG